MDPFTGRHQRRGPPSLSNPNGSTRSFGEFITPSMLHSTHLELASFSTCFALFVFPIIQWWVRYHDPMSDSCSSLCLGFTRNKGNVVLGFIGKQSKITSSYYYFSTSFVFLSSAGWSGRTRPDRREGRAALWNPLKTHVYWHVNDISLLSFFFKGWCRSSWKINWDEGEHRFYWFIS